MNKLVLAVIGVVIVIPVVAGLSIVILFGSKDEQPIGIAPTATPSLIEYSVGGAVVSPGSYTFAKDASAWEVIDGAGGPSHGAVLSTLPEPKLLEYYGCEETITCWESTTRLSVGSAISDPLKNLPDYYKAGEYALPPELRSKLVFYHNLIIPLVDLSEIDLAGWHRFLADNGFAQVRRSDGDRPGETTWYRVVLSTHETAKKVGSFDPSILGYSAGVRNPTVQKVRIMPLESTEVLPGLTKYASHALWDIGYGLGPNYVQFGGSNPLDELLETLAGQPIGAPQINQAIVELVELWGSASIGQVLARLPTSSGEALSTTISCGRCSIWEQPLLLSEWIKLDGNYSVTDEALAVLKAPALEFSGRWDDAVAAKLLQDIRHEPVRSPRTKAKVVAMVDDLGLDPTWDILGRITSSSGSTISELMGDPQRLEGVSELVAHWLETEDALTLTEESTRLIAQAGKVYEGLSNFQVELWLALEDKEADLPGEDRLMGFMEQEAGIREEVGYFRPKRGVYSSVYVAVWTFPQCQPEFGSMEARFPCTEGFSVTIKNSKIQTCESFTDALVIKLSAASILDLVEYDPDHLTIPRSSILSFISFVIGTSLARSGESMTSAIGTINEVYDELPASEVPLDMAIAGLITRNVPVYDEVEGDWVRFDTWSKRYIQRNNMGSESTFAEDPVGGTISIIIDPSPENIRKTLNTEGLIP